MLVCLEPKLVKPLLNGADGKVQKLVITFDNVFPLLVESKVLQILLQNSWVPSFDEEVWVLQCQSTRPSSTQAHRKITASSHLAQQGT